MFVTQLSVNFLIFAIGFAGIMIHRRSILFIMISLELILLSLSLNFVLFSVYFDDVYGQLFSLFILTVAAAESAVGLAIIISYYRIRGSISTNQVTTIRRQWQKESQFLACDKFIRRYITFKFSFQIQSRILFI